MTNETSWAGIPIFNPQPQGQQQGKSDRSFEMPKENLEEAKTWEGIPIFGGNEFYIGKKFDAFPNARDSTGVLMEDENGQIFKSTGDTWESQKFSPKNIADQPGRTGLRVVGRENPKESLKRFSSPHTSELFGVSVGVKNPDVWAKSEQDLEKPEDTLWSGVRTGMQFVKALPWMIPQSRATLATAELGAGGLNSLGDKAKYIGPSEDEIQELKSNFERHGIDYDEATLRQDLEKGVEKAGEYVPTLGKLWNWLEEKGVPMEAKTPFQKTISVGSDVMALSTKKKEIAGPASVLAMTMYNSLLNQKVPEPIAGFFARAMGMAWGEYETKSPEVAAEPVHPGSRQEIGETPRTEFEREKDIVKYFTKDEPLQKKSQILGDRGVNVELAKFEQPKTGKELKVTQKKEDFPISDLAKKQLKLEGLEIRSPSEPITPKERVGESISLLKSKSPSETGESAKRIVNENERDLMEQANEKYTTGEKLTSDVEKTPEEMIPELEALHRDWKDSSDPVEKDVAIESKKLLDEVRKEAKKEPREQLTKAQREHEIAMFGESIGPVEEAAPELIAIPTKVSFFSKRIKELRSGMKHKFENDPENKYGRLTEIINKQIVRSLKDEPEALKAMVEADKFYKEEYAPLFKNKEAMPFLDKTNVRYANLYETLKTPDGYNFFKPIFEKTPDGTRLLRTIRRDIIEDTVKDFIEKAGKFDKNSVGKKRLIEDSLDRLGIGVTRGEKNAIFRTIVKMKNELEETQIEAKKPPEAKKPEIKGLEFKSNKWFEQADTKDIVKELDDVKKVKAYRQKSKISPEREKEFDKIARDAGIARIMKNKTPNEVTHKDIKEALRDVNTKEYLKETLGNETVAIFEKRIADIEKWEEDIAKYESQMKSLERQRTEAAEAAKKSLLSRKMELMAKIAKKELTMYALNQIPVLPHFLKQGITDATFDK